MAIHIIIMPSAERDLKAMDQVAVRRVAKKLRAIEEHGKVVGDVKRLTGQPPRFRLRVGDYRVLFRMEDDTMNVYRVAHRREAYE